MIFLTFLLLISNFYRFYPTNSGVMVSKTDVNIALVNDTLIIAARCHSPNGIYSMAVDRDHIELGEDFFGIILTQNKNSGYFFLVNASGTKQDGIIVQKSVKKKEWDFLWDVNTTKISDTLWIARFKIPLKEMELKINDDSLILFANFVRSACLSGAGNFEAGTYVKIEGTNFYNLQFTKRFAFPIERKKSFSVSNRPYFAFYHDKNGSNFQSGGDISFKTKELNSDITINPEYFTVEEDVEEFNLDKAEMLYYPEKRPFFMKGFELWNMPFQVLYTRRIQDIDAGLKFNFNIKKLGVNFFILEEKDSIETSISRNRVTGGARVLFATKKIEIGGFYINSRSKNGAKGVDLLSYLPVQMRLNIQLTVDFNNKTDVFVHFYRPVNRGLNIESGFERLDSVDIRTAYLPYPTFTRSFWLYLTYNFSREGKFLPYCNIGIGGTHGEFLNNRLYENSFTAFLTLGFLNNFQFTYNYIPSERAVDWEGTIYKNYTHYINLTYQPFNRHYISFDTQFGDYYGGYLKYYSIEYSYRGDKIHLSSGYGYDEEPFYTQKRFYLKGKINVSKSLKFRIFIQHSDISGENDVNFLSTYDFKPGTSLYFVVNRKFLSNGSKETNLILMFQSNYEIW